MLLQMENRTQEFIARAKEYGYFVFDVEHDSSLRPEMQEFALWGCGFCVADLYFYIADQQESLDLLRALFREGLIPVGHNVKYDLKAVRACGIQPHEMPKTSYCTMIAINLLEDNRHYNAIGLKALTKEFFGHQMMEYKEAAAFGKDSPEFHKYGEEDVFWTWKLAELLFPRVRQEGCWKVFEKILGKSNLVFADIELKGICWDAKLAVELYQQFSDIAEKCKAEFQEFVGYDVNLDSPKQLATRLYEDMKISTRGLKVSKKTQKPGVDEKNIEILSKKYPKIRALRAYRTAVKQINTYVQPLTELAERLNGRIHANFWLTSSTGRTRSSDPNLQNITARWSRFIKDYFKDISLRKALIAAPGHKLLCVDFSQIELRLIAHITKDPKLLDAYLSYQCKDCGAKGRSTDILHSCPKCGAAENPDVIDPSTPDARGFWHGLDLHGITARELEPLEGDRNAGKVCNFQIVYFANEYSLNSYYPTLPVSKWREVREAYLNNYKGVDRWHNLCEAKLRLNKCCGDLFGRKRRFTESQIRDQYKHTMNQMINFSPQSSASLLIQLCSSAFRDRMMAKGYWFTDVCIINSVHDELTIECREDLVPEVARDIQECLETTAKFIVPLRADVNVADNWADGK